MQDRFASPAADVLPITRTARRLHFADGFPISPANGSASRGSAIPPEKRILQLIRRIGLSEPVVVRLAMAQQVPAVVREQVGRTSARMVAGQPQVPAHFDGLAFQA